MRILQRIFLDLLLVSTLILGEKLSKEGILPQREKETHFPAMPNMPNMFILVSEANETHEYSLILEDTPGLPLGAKETDFEKGSADDDNLIEDGDAIVLDAEDPLEASSDLFEGDISGVKLTSVPEEQEEEEDSYVNENMKNAIKNTYQRWPEGEIPYVISNSFSSQERSIIRQAMEQFSSHSCVKWRPHLPTDMDYVHILRDSGCYSRVGRTGRAQVLSLGYGCVRLGTVIHEMLHASGFWHEQSRPDRDEHVEIFWSNIQAGMEDNFARYSRAEVSTLSLPYDTDSVMHYSSTAFSRNGQYTIKPKLNKITSLGQRRGFSSLDIQKLNKLYQCQNLVTCKDFYTPQSGLCQTWKTKGGCERYPKFMKDHCSVTCGLCSSGSIGSVTNPITVALRCYDKDKRCPAWAAYANQCQSNRLFMSRMCKKTCGLCDKEKQNGNDHNTDENMRTSMATNLRTPKFWRDGVFCILSTILYTYL